MTSRRQTKPFTMIEYILVAVATFITIAIIAVMYAAALSLLRLAGKVKNALWIDGTKTK